MVNEAFGEFSAGIERRRGHWGQEIDEAMSRPLHLWNILGWAAEDTQQQSHCCLFCARLTAWCCSIRWLDVASDQRRLPAAEILVGREGGFGTIAKRTRGLERGICAQREAPVHGEVGLSLGERLIPPYFCPQDSHIRLAGEGGRGTRRSSRKRWRGGSWKPPEGIKDRIGLYRGGNKRQDGLIWGRE